MKKKKKLTITAILCIVIAIVVFLATNVFRYPKPTYNGNRIHNDSQFILDFTEINGTETNTLQLAEGDEVHCTWSIERGTVDIFITGDNSDQLYQGNHIDQADFILTADVAGSYTITVNGENARGVIDIQRIEK